MHEGKSVYKEKTDEIFKQLERHSFVVDPDTRVVELSIAMDAVEDAFGSAEKFHIEISPLEFIECTAVTAIGTYDIDQNESGGLCNCILDGVLIGGAPTIEESIKFCSEHYENIIRSCLISNN